MDLQEEEAQIEADLLEQEQKVRPGELDAEVNDDEGEDYEYEYEAEHTSDDGVEDWDDLSVNDPRTSEAAIMLHQKELNIYREVLRKHLEEGFAETDTEVLENLRESLEITEVEHQRLLRELEEA